MGGGIGGRREVDGGGRLTLQTCGRWKVGPTSMWEVEGWPYKHMGGGRLALQACGRWQVGPTSMWEVEGWPYKHVEGGRLATKTDGLDHFHTTSNFVYPDEK